MKESRLLRHLRSLPAWLILLLVIVATTLLWAHDTALTRFTDQPQLWLGVVTTVVLWILVLVAGATGLRLRRVARQLETLRSRRDIENAHLPTDPETPDAPPGWRYVPAWLMLLMGGAAAAVVWRYEDSLLAFTDQPRLWLGVTASAVLGLMVLANAVNRFVARRATATLRTARRREALTLETMQALQVMISASTPDGARSRFNAYYRMFTGKTEEQLRGRGWLECVHPDDREQCIGTIVNHEARAGQHLELEYTLVASDGEHRWIREFLVPRFGADGTLLEYVASATDITAYVQNETEHEQFAEDLRKKNKHLKSENEQITAERNELVQRITGAEQKAQEAAEVLAAANDQLDKTLIELKAIKSERTQLRADNGKLGKSIEQLNQKLLEAEKARGRAEEQLASTRKELQQLQGELKGVIKEREGARAEAERAGTDKAKLERAVQNLQAGEKTLRDELQQARADLKTASQELAAARAELEKSAGAMGKLQQTVDGFQATEEALREQIKQGENDVKAAKQEHEATRAELKKLTSSVNPLEKTIEQLKKSEAALKEQMEKDRDSQEKARAEATDARRKASQHRAKINRLTTRCKELEDKLATITGERDQLTGRVTAAEQSAAAQTSRRRDADSKPGAVTGGPGLDRELSSELRLALSSVARINEQLRESSLDETQRSFLENAQASVDAMTSLIEEAVGGGGSGPERGKGKLSVRAFDLRAAAKGVCDIVQPAAEQRKVAIKCSVDHAVPPLVSTDPVRLRQVLMYLLNSAIRLVEGGEINLGVTADGITSAHATLRFEIRHASARVGADQMETTFSLNRPDGAKDADPARQQAAKAWQLISEMKGQFAFELPENGGFKIWFNLTLPKLTAAKDAPELATPAKPVRPAEPASVPLAATAPEPEPRRAGASAAPAAPASPAGGDRMAPRLPQEMLESNLGNVLELGADSARVQCSKVPKGNVRFELLSGDGRVRLPSEVVSSDRMGVRKFSVVLRFRDVSADQRRQIMQIVFAHRKGATMLPMDHADNGGD